MRRAARWIGGTTMVWCLLLASAVVADAATCGDANRTGTVTVSAAGRTASPAARARAAGTTPPCSGAGFTEDDGILLTFVECREGDYLTDGTLVFGGDGSNLVTVAFDTTDFVV